MSGIYGKLWNLMAKLTIRRRLNSSESYIAYLRKLGVDIGEGTYIKSPGTVDIDRTRPSLITIGKNCFINEYFELYTHDWVTHVFINTERDFLNSSGRVSIGNNVAFGCHVIVLKGVTIGDNCFIGANSLVTKDIPANSVVAGSPAKVIMSIDDLYKKRLAICQEEAFDYARSIQERYGRRPIPADFWEEFPLFVSGDEVNKYPEIPIRRQLGPIYDRYVREHKKIFSSFKSFLEAAGIK